MAGLAKHLMLLAAIVPLTGCTVGFSKWQSERANAQAEFQHMRTQQHERDNYTACVERGAMPGSPENLQCQMEMAKKEQQVAKPPSPP